jgi:hypothetical protein
MVNGQSKNGTGGQFVDGANSQGKSELKRAPFKPQWFLEVAHIEVGIRAGWV